MYLYSIMEEDLIIGLCEVCNKDTLLMTTTFVFTIHCKCCHSMHHQNVKHCVNCIPNYPKTVSYLSRSGVIIENMNTELITFIYGN